MVFFSNAEPKTKRSPSMTPIDLSLYFPTSNDSHLFADWVKALSLTIEDKRILMEGDWLSANHISAAQHLLRKAFPSQHGLQDTHYLAEKNEWLSSPKKFVQVLFIPPGHWACLSNKFCASDEVDLFDSLHTLPIADGSIAKQASRILQSNSPSMVINVINVQRQDNYSDCGLFALAMAYDLCSNIDPSKSGHVQARMREHMCDCYENENISPFPYAPKPARSKRVLHKVQVDLHCICRQPESKPMACCDQCYTWYHPNCVDIPEQVFEQPDCPWVCEPCKLWQ